MKEIIFLRHGDTDATENHYFAGWSDLPLTKKGEKRIKAAKEILKNYEYLEIWSSPLIRTRQTAQIVVNSNYSIQYTEDIKERSFGEWEGKNWELLEQEFPSYIHHPCSSGNDFIIKNVCFFISQSFLCSLKHFLRRIYPSIKKNPKSLSCMGSVYA
jgi:broad specificity phosphatase PhoE